MARVYDLQSLYDRLNRIYFDSKLELKVRWSAREPQKASRSVLLGFYSPQKKEIVISKRLDNISIPLFFLEHVIFHEMLHAVFPSEKHKMHTEKFRNFEKLHPDYDRAKKWEKDSVKILLNPRPQSLSLWDRVKKAL